MIRRLSLAVFASCVLHAPSAWADACSTQLPDTLVKQLELKYPEYRSPLCADNRPEYVEWNSKEGGSGCWGVAAADFDGQHGQDYLVLMTARTGSGALTVLALNGRKGWKLRVLDKQNEGRAALYVAAVKPGTYKRTEALAGSNSSGEEMSMHCKYAGAEFGTLESSSVVYCRTGSRWRYTWISD